MKNIKNEVVEISIIPKELYNEKMIKEKCATKLKLKPTDIREVKIIRRSVDARPKRPVYRLRVQVIRVPEEQTDLLAFIPQQVTSQKKVLIIGAGPAGYFAALECIHQNLIPIIIERGKDVQARRRDLKAIQQDGTVNPDSNYCFGEGGAGTYSDGKLYTRSHKRGNIEQILKILVEHGANTDILIDAHPHIGSNKLPGIINKIRESILSCGGQVLFNHRVMDFIMHEKTCMGVVVRIDDKEVEIKGDAVILATGHSARDIFDLCIKNDVPLEAKAFALGVRIEHPQALIDEIQYNQKNREANLPASSYSLASQDRGVGVFSFCMCPGGLIVPTATAPGELVVNGMSLSKRDSPYANAGTVVEISLPYLEKAGFSGVLAGVDYQKSIEQSIFEAGDGSQKAPAQKLTDFINRKITTDDMKSSYIPGVYAAPIHSLLPDFISDHLHKAILQFESKMKGYLTAEAHIVGLESRTSSPIRIPRDVESFLSPGIDRLFPCGEGAGFAGGILSAAMDGINVARKVSKHLA